MATKLENAKAALERLRVLANAGGVHAPDVEALVAYFTGLEKGLLGAVDLLGQSRNTFRSKQIERARKMLEELL